MADVTVTAIRTFLRNGEQYLKGADVTLSPIEAATEARKGNVSLTRPTRAREMKADPPSATIKTSRRRYRRRDMAAAETK